MLKIKKGDQIIVTTGRSKGVRGQVMRVLGERGRLIIEGVNLVKKHVKPNPQRNEPGGIKEIEASIHISNVALYNPVTNKADKVGIKNLDDGKKVRYFKSNGELVDV